MACPNQLILYHCRRRPLSGKKNPHLSPCIVPCRATLRRLTARSHVNSQWVMVVCRVGLPVWPTARWPTAQWSQSCANAVACGRLAQTQPHSTTLTVPLTGYSNHRSLFRGSQFLFIKCAYIYKSRCVAGYSMTSLSRTSTATIMSSAGCYIHSRAPARAKPEPSNLEITGLACCHPSN